MADRTRKDRAARPSITSHRLFPVVVVLWFGALFGLGSLAIRPALLEGLVSAAKIDRMIPMAAAPLGTTTRILVALLMTGLGCLIGAVVARRFAKPGEQQSRARRRRPAPPALSDDAASPVVSFGAVRLDGDADGDAEEEVQPTRRRRRQLAIMDAEETFEDHAPLPGSTQILSVSDLPLKSFDEVDEVWLHSSDRARPRAENTTPVTREVAHDPGEETAEPGSNRLFEAYVRRVDTSESAKADAGPTPGFASLAHVDPHAFMADGDAPTAEADADAIASELDSELDTGLDSVLDTGLDTGPGGDPAYANSAERIATAPLDALSHVELLERLALTIAGRRAEWTQARESRMAATTAATNTAHEAAPRFDVTAAEAAEPAQVATPESDRAESRVPAALRAHWLDGEDDDDDALPTIVPPRNFTMKPVVAAPAQADDEAVLAKGYSSLIGMTRPAPRQEFVRSDEPANAAASQAAVPFPRLHEDAAFAPVSAASPPRVFDAPQAVGPAPDQTEQALRAALATLRRMSGAA